jgi:precorrin-3B synthase
MSAPVRSINVVPPRRGFCPGLSQPLPTGDGLLVRILPTGTIALDAFAALCAAALSHGNGIIEITARGSIQVRGLSTHSAPRFADAIAAQGIAADDSVPIICNPLAGLDVSESFDASAFATALRRALTPQSIARHLDPKVSVVVDSGAALNVAQVAADIRVGGEIFNGETVLRLAVGGNEATGSDLGVIAAEDGVEAVLRLLLILAQRGARARDIVATEGIACFADALLFARRVATKREVSAGCRGRDAIGLHPLRDGSFASGVALAFGHAGAAALEKLAEAAATAGARGLRAAPDRTLFVIGVARESAARFVTAAAQLGFVTRADDSRRHVFACAGAPLCASAHIAARAIAPALAVAAAPYLRDGLTVHISGCAKGCAHPGAAPLTVVGTPGGCDLVANGAARDAAFATAFVHDLPAQVAAYLRDRDPATANSHASRSHSPNQISPDHD